MSDTPPADVETCDHRMCETVPPDVCIYCGKTDCTHSDECSYVQAERAALFALTDVGVEQAHLESPETFAECAECPRRDSYIEAEERAEKAEAALRALMLEHEAAGLLLTRDEFGTIAWDGVSSTYTVAEDALDRLEAAHQAARELNKRYE